MKFLIIGLGSMGKRRIRNLQYLGHKEIIGFETKFTVKGAALDLKDAFEKKLLPNSFEDEKYFNIKRMQSIKLA